MVTTFFAMLVLSSVESKKKKKQKNRVQVDTLQKLCRGPLPPSTKKNILELQAFFDLSKVRDFL